MYSKWRKLSRNIKIYLIFYPFFTLFSIPAAFIHGLYNLREINFRKLSSYLAYTPHASVNNLFYVTEYLNLKSYGRQGISPTLGLGKFPLKSWFFLSMISLGLFVRAGTLATILCSLFWVFSFSFFSTGENLLWSIFISFSLLLSSVNFAMSFIRQNYQIISFSLIPSFFYMLQTDFFLLSCLIMMIIAETGITAYVLIFPFITLLAIENTTFSPLFIYAFGMLPLLVRMRTFLFDQDFKKLTTNIAKLIGATSVDTLYKREVKKLTFPFIYFSTLYLILFVLISIINVETQYSLLLGMLIYICNEKFFRLADDQTIYMLNATMLTLVVLSQEASIANYLVFLLGVNPLPFLLQIQSFDASKGVAKVPIPRPFDLSDLLEEMKKFLSAVPPSQRIITSFKDPKTKYEDIFDGYRCIHELTLHVANQEKVHCMPDWWAISETNYVGAPNIWGRSPVQVKNNCTKWNADYAIIYQVQNKNLDDVWKKDFILVSEFDWELKSNGFPEHRLWPKDFLAPKLFLLKVRV